MIQKTQIKSGKSLGKFIGSVIEESVKQALYQRSLTEKDKQDAISSNMNSIPEKKNSDHSSKTMEDDDEAMETGNVSVDDVIDKLNAIRSGHSFRDEKVKSNMQQYVDSLSAAEKTALLSFLKGISQIVTGEIPAPEASAPRERPADVKMQKGKKQSQVKHIDPNVIKLQTPKTTDKGKNKGAEDTSGPVPITPKNKK